MAEVAFESVQLKLEAVRGTILTPPDHWLNMVGTLTPMRELYRAPDTTATLAEHGGRTQIVRKWGELAADGDLDPWMLPVLANMALKGGITTPATPPSAVLTKSWVFPRSITADDLKSATEYFGDPNQKIYQGGYGMLDELTIKSQPTGNDGTKMSVKGHTHFLTQLGAAPTPPAQALGPLIVPGWIAVYADTSLAIGTTLIVGRVLNVEHTFPTGVTYKWPGQGPASGLDYHHTGRKKTHCTTKITLDMVDQTEYNLYEGAQQVKLRVIHYGSAIETVTGPLTYYNMVQVDMYGTLDSLKWANYEGNRTMELTMESEENATAGTDAIVTVYNTRATL
jgi:hypothetical protein